MISPDEAKAQAIAAAPSAVVPRFAVNYRPTLNNGRLSLQGEQDGCWVWVQPKEWSPMTFPPEGAAPTAARGDVAPLTAAGVNLPSLQAHAGQLQTNDPGFGASLLTSTECRPRAESPDAGLSPLVGAVIVISAVILGVGFVVGALVLRSRR